MAIARFLHNRGDLLFNYRLNEGMRQLLLAMRRRELPLTEAMAINDDAKARAEAAAGKCDVPANDEYLGRCAREMGEILELETDT